MYVSRKKITLHEGTVSAYMEKFSYWKNISSIFESEMNENFLLIIIGITRGGVNVLLPFPINSFLSFGHFCKQGMA